MASGKLKYYIRNTEAGVAQSVLCLDYRLDNRGSILGRDKEFFL
jgi:hypothetical protein